MEASKVYETVNTKYSSIASSTHADDAPASHITHIASSFGYSVDELASLPSGTNLGLSCGNPLATANLHPSETMLDLGSGGGLDCLIAANQVLKADATPTGKIFGVDRSESMITLARQNAHRANIPTGLVEFIHAPITDIPLEDASADLVVSNCVINLVPDRDKPQVFREIYRLLKPGGRVAISDLLAKGALPDDIRKDAALLVGCVAGASLVEEYRRWMLDAGFQEDSVALVDTQKDLNVYHDQGSVVSCCGKNEETRKNNPAGDDRIEKLDFNHWVAAYQIYAVKGPAGE